MEINQIDPTGVSSNNQTTQTPNPQNQAPKHKSHGGLIAAIIILVVAALAAVFLIDKQEVDNISNVNIQDGLTQEEIEQILPEGDTVILEENASDDLNSIEADLESLDIENLDSGLE